VAVYLLRNNVDTVMCFCSYGVRGEKFTVLLNSVLCLILRRPDALNARCANEKVGCSSVTDYTLRYCLAVFTVVS
jgi:hypothetical protein